jgi:hypothetical protein
MMIVYESRKLTSPSMKAPKHHMKKRIKFSEDYYEMTLSKFGRRKEFGKRETLEDLKESLRPLR